MKRVGWTLVGAMLLALLPVSVGGCNITCGCATPADPNWTPPPVSADQAAVYGAKFAGVPAMSIGFMGQVFGRQLYETTSPNAIALVDAESGVVFEVILTDQMPSDATVAPGANPQPAAEAFLARVGLSTEGFTESGRLTQQAGVAYYDVTWNDPSATATPRFEVLVNASTEAAFAFADLRAQSNLALPIVGRARAIDAAIASVGVLGETVTSADLGFDFGSGDSQNWAWSIGLGVPSATQADVYEHGALVSVDAVTGQATIVKS